MKIFNEEIANICAKILFKIAKKIPNSIIYSGAFNNLIDFIVNFNLET